MIITIILNSATQDTRPEGPHGSSSSEIIWIFSTVVVIAILCAIIVILRVIYKRRSKLLYSFL